jgi:hypothetical protein
MATWRARIACWIPKATSTDTEYVVLFVIQYNNVCTNKPQCYVIRTLTLFLMYEFSLSINFYSKQYFYRKIVCAQVCRRKNL